MNILMALSQLEVTGAEVYATSVGNELTRRGHQVFYVSDTLTKAHDGLFFKLRFNKRSIPRRFWHVAYLVYLIKKHQIQLVHAHSRASSWSCHIACRLTNTPMVTTVHGRQPVHASRKKFHAMGDKALPVCEAIREQLIKDLDVPESQLHVSRNGIETGTFKRSAAPNNPKPVISIIGRLSGPKGELCYRLLTECLDLGRYQVQVITGTPLTERFSALQDKVSFPGYSANVEQVMAQSDLVIGAGRVAMEALLCGRPTLAIGEASCAGIIELENLNQAMATNFGDIGPQDLAIDFQQIPALIEQGLSQPHCAQEITEQIRLNYDLQAIVDELESLYQTVYVSKLQREVPIIMYHRFIRDDSEKGVHGTYLHVKQLEKHFQLLKKMGFESLTFKDLAEKGFIHRLQPGKRFIMITVDDGYRDNHELLLPLLKKYQFKAVVYVVTGENFNRWDVQVSDNPEKVVPLMSPEQVKELHDSGLVEIGGHTMTHPFLSKLSEAEQREEVLRNKLELEELVGEPLTSFAYPYGDHDATSKRLALELGYPFAVATNSGPLLMHQDPYQIRRIAIFPRTNSFGLWRKVKGNYLFRKMNKKNNKRLQMAGFGLIAKLRNKIRVKPNNSIQIGKNTRVRYCDIYVNGENNQLIIHDGANLKGVSIELNGNNCLLEIGTDCVIGQNCFISCRERNTILKIGNECMFSRNIKIMTSDGHDILRNGKRINPAKSIYIGSHVWLADNVTILKGVHIGNDSIVGINSTLTKSIETNVIAVGNPAKVIQNNINWEEKLTY